MRTSLTRKPLITSFGEFRFDENNVLIMIPNGDNQDLTSVEISEAYHALQLYIGDQKLFLFIDNSQSFSPERKFRMFYESLFLDYCLGVVFYSSTERGVYVASTITGLSKVRIPIKVKATKELAMGWLQDEMQKVRFTVQESGERFIRALEVNGWKKELETDLAYYFMADNQILHVESKENVITTKMVNENFVRLKNFIGPDKVKIYIDNTKSLPYPKEHRDLYEKQMNEICKAVAVVTKSLPGKIFTNMMLALVKTEYPVRLFNDNQGAMTWLETIMDSSEGLVDPAKSA